MARHPQPREVAELKGSDKHDPQRYRGEVPKHTAPLGNAPEAMAEDAQACWFELQAYAIPGTLTYSERASFEMFANLFAQYRRDPDEFPAAKSNLLIGMFARFGMTPADRQKLAVEKTKSDDPFSNLEQ